MKRNDWLLAILVVVLAVALATGAFYVLEQVGKSTGSDRRDGSCRRPPCTHGDLQALPREAEGARST